MPLNPLNTSNSLDQNFGQITDMFRELYDRQQTEVFKDSTGTRRVLLGDGGNNFYGLKVSPPGVDVYTATDSQLVFNSSQDVFKIIKTITVASPAYSLTAPGAGNFTGVDATKSVAHGLAQPPAILAFLISSGAIQQMPYVYAPTTAGGGKSVVWLSYGVTVDATNVTFRINAQLTGAANWSEVANATQAKVYILQETAN